MSKNLTSRMGNCKHRKYIPQPVELVRNGSSDPQSVPTRVEPMTA